MPRVEDDDLCVCGHMLIGHDRSLENMPCNESGCPCQNYHEETCREVVMYECLSCGSRWESRNDARGCAASRKQNKLRTGDIIHSPNVYRYGWFDGDKDWIALERVDAEMAHRRHTPPNRDIPGHYNYSPFYVVLAVKNAGPCWQGLMYDIASMAFTGDKGHRYTTTTSLEEYLWTVSANVETGWGDIIPSLKSDDRQKILDQARQLVWGWWRSRYPEARLPFTGAVFVDEMADHDKIKKETT